MTKQYNLSMTPGDVDVIVPVSQLDDGIRTIVFNLVNGSGDSGEFTMPDHAVVTIEAIKPDKKVVSYSTIESPEIISVVGSIITVIPPQQLTAVAGNVFAKIKITDPDNVRESNSIESSRIVFAVDACPLGADPDTSESSLGPVVALVQEAQGYATAAAGGAAEAANPTVAQDLPDGAQITASCQVESVTGGKVGIGIRYNQYGGTYTRIGNLISSTGISTISTKIDVGATSIEAFITQEAAVTAYSIGQIQVGLSISDYQPFRGRQTVRVDFGREVGAGTFDAGSGLLTVTHGIYDASNATIGGTVSLAEFTPFPAMASGAWSNDADARCNVLPKVGSAQSMGARFADRKVYLCNLKNTYTSLKTLDAIRAWVAEVGLKVAYPLAEPLTIQLDPAAVMAMPGYNNIWTDGAFRGTYSRSMNVTYRRHAWEV